MIVIQVAFTVEAQVLSLERLLERTTVCGDGSVPPLVAEKVRALYKVVLSRLPTAAEADRLVRYIDNVGNPARAYPDIYWALLNSAEFMLNH